MKSTILLFSALIISTLITSCNNQKSQVFESSSKDKSLAITVWGERPGSIDPWTVYVVANFNSQKDTVFTELHADELNSKNVQFDWINNTNCIVKLTHRDGMVIPVPIRYQVTGK